jgi:hypothetical protein
MGFVESSIHGRVLLRMADSYPWRQEWLDLCADLPATAPTRRAAGRPVVVEVTGTPGLDMRAAREVGHGIFNTPTGVIDSIYGVEVAWRDPGHLVINCTRPSLEWAMPSLLLAGLRAGCAFMHGAALERDGVAWLFPSWGGVGKTALVASLVRSHGWRMLGDDFVVVTDDGDCLAFPKPMVLYPYHRALFPEVFSAGRGPAAPAAFNAALTRAAVAIKPMLRRFPTLLQWARRNNPQSVRVPPSQVFGRDKLAASGRIGGAVFLERVTGLSAPRLDDADGGLVGRAFGTTLSEFDPRCTMVCNVALGSGHLGPDEFYGPWVRTLEEGLEDRPQYVLRLPADCPVEHVVDAVLDLLGERLAVGGAA